MIVMAFETYLQDILRNVSAALLVPVMIILAGFCVYALYCLGSIITEAIMQRSHYKENIPGFITQIEAAPAAEVRTVILESGMLLPHKKALVTVAENMQMAPADLFALSTREEELLDEHYGAVTARTDQVAKLAPMFGLMGTLIPLGPGIVALGIGDTETLSNSLLVAFDTTIAGLAAGAVCSVVGRIRKSWYKKYTDAVHAAMVSLLQKAETLRTQAAQPTLETIVAAQEDALACVDEAERIVEKAERTQQIERAAREERMQQAERAAIEERMQQAEREAQEARAQQEQAFNDAEWSHLRAAAPDRPTQPMMPVAVEAPAEAAMAAAAPQAPAEAAEEAIVEQAEEIVEQAEEIVQEAQTHLPEAAPAAQAYQDYREYQEYWDYHEYQAYQQAQAYEERQQARADELAAQQAAFECAEAAAQPALRVTLDGGVVLTGGRL